jgi:hypothetical protein
MIIHYGTYNFELNIFLIMIYVNINLNIHFSLPILFAGNLLV